jgi:branched-chain amino acid transport system substrate-binding protein
LITTNHNKETKMTINQQRRQLMLGAAAAAGASLLPGMAAAASATPLKVGLIIPMSGPFASTGRQVEAAVKLYLQQHGDTVAGRRSTSSSRMTAGWRRT